MSFKEYFFEFSVEGENMSDCEFKTPQEARDAADARYQELCDDGDYDHNEKGDAYIYCLDADSGCIVMSEAYSVSAEEPCEIADGRGELRV